MPGVAARAQGMASMDAVKEGTKRTHRPLQSNRLSTCLCVTHRIEADGAIYQNQHAMPRSREIAHLCCEHTVRHDVLRAGTSTPLPVRAFSFQIAPTKKVYRPQ